MSHTDALNLQYEIRQSVEAGSAIHTDKHGAYNGLSSDYGHEAVDHGAIERVRDDVTTNGIESVWAVTMRGLHCVYHYASEKHLHRCVNESTIRLNEGDGKHHTLKRLASLVTACVGPHIKYGELTA